MITVDAEIQIEFLYQRKKKNVMLAQQKHAARKSHNDQGECAETPNLDEMPESSTETPRDSKKQPPER